MISPLNRGISAEMWALAGGGGRVGRSPRTPLRVCQGGPAGKEVLTLETFSTATRIYGKEAAMKQPYESTQEAEDKSPFPTSQSEAGVCGCGQIGWLWETFPIFTTWSSGPHSPMPRSGLDWFWVSASWVPGHRKGGQLPACKRAPSPGPLLCRHGSLGFTNFNLGLHFISGTLGRKLSFVILGRSLLRVSGFPFRKWKEPTPLTCKDRKTHKNLL